MHGETICEVCKVLFKWRRENKRTSLPRWCGVECRKKSDTPSFDKGGPRRISTLSSEEKFDRLKKSYEKNVIRNFGCWGWQGGLDKGGYGIMTCNRRHGPDRGHRASWVIHKGKIPMNMLVCHKCDHPECTNPDHLFLGTPAENTKDMIQKNRKCIGEKSPTSKLKEDDVIAIKALLKAGKSYPKIAKMFEMGVSAIARIKRGETWSHVT